MNKKSIYTHSDYKVYLLSLEQQGLYKGFRSRLAEQTGCQNAFISQVLNGEVNFNLEQAFKIASFLELNEDERQYFLWMLEHKRAGTQELKKYFHQLMAGIKEKSLNLKERVQIPQALSGEAEATYYSSWIYSAVHVASMLPKLNTAKKIAAALELPEELTTSIAKFLVKNGLLEQNGEVLTSGKIQLHLDRDSANINKHHSNWRIEALKSLDRKNNKKDLHYSGVSSLSKADAEKIRLMFVDVVENYVRTIEKSPEETVYTFNLDFFQLVTANF
jgi:uncharacterized protein (TIGR02147 family)